MCNFHPLRTKSSKILSGHFSGLKFLVGHTVRQTDKKRQIFQKFAGFVRQTDGFHEDSDKPNSAIQQ